MLKKLIYGFVVIRTKSPEKGSVGVNRAKQVSYLLLTSSKTRKCQADCTLLNCRIIRHNIPGLPFSYIYISRTFR